MARLSPPCSRRSGWRKGRPKSGHRRWRKAEVDRLQRSLAFDLLARAGEARARRAERDPEPISQTGVVDGLGKRIVPLRIGSRAGQVLVAVAAKNGARRVELNQRCRNRLPGGLRGDSPREMKRNLVRAGNAAARR